MLFQNSCEVPFGMTAIVSFFFPLFDPERLQLKATIAANMINIEMIFRIVYLLSLNLTKQIFPLPLGEGRAYEPVGKSISLCRLCGSLCLCGGIAQQNLTTEAQRSHRGPQRRILRHTRMEATCNHIQTMTYNSCGPCTPMVSVNSISAVREGPVIKVIARLMPDWPRRRT